MRIDAQPCARVMDDRRRSCRIERRLGDLVARLGLTEVRVFARLDEGVVARDGIDKVLRRHRYALVFHHDLAGELFDTVRAEEKSCVEVDMRRLRDK